MDKINSSFFDALYEDNRFVKALGRLVMSSAKFETRIKEYIDASGNVNYGEKQPLGILLKLLVENHNIDQTSIYHFNFLLHQRNYFVHRLHLYLSDYPSNDFELSRFVNRAESVSEEMEFFSRILEKESEKTNISKSE